MLVIFTALFGLTLWPGAGAKAQEEGWREKYYNPVPMADDLILPMPCGGAMAFRRIDTPNSDGLIGDVPVTLGQEGDDRPYLNGLWRSYVSGAFSDATGDHPKGYFYMAKYELAEAQYDAVMAGTCPDKPPRARAFVPKVGLSKLEYMAFSEAYTIWLLSNAPDQLPREGETRSYLRLPTEEEWEFAARGGTSVEPSLFRAQRFPIGAGEDYNEFVAHGGSDSAGGTLQIIGSLKPNPLGLHDILGNAAEIVETPFSLVRHGRLHGQAGGVVKRGGDARTPIGSITSASRFELPPFDILDGVPTADRFTGTRLVIAGLAITSQEQADALTESLKKLAAPDPRLSTASTEEEVIALLEDLRENSQDDQLRSSLTLIKDTIDRGRAARNTLRDNSIRLILTSGVLICDQAVQRYLNALAAALTIEHDLAELEEQARREGDEDFLRAVLEQKELAAAKLEELHQSARGNVIEYANIIEGLAEDYSSELLNRQTDTIRPTIEAGGTRRRECLRLLNTHLSTRIAAGLSDVDLIVLDIEEVALNQAAD
jgi:hypothetical protein